MLRQKLAAIRPAARIEPWYGPPRGLDFERDVQPVLEKYCVACHDGTLTQNGQTTLDLRAERYAKNYEGRELTKLGATRLHPVVREAFGGTQIKYTPAYEALIPYIRRVNVEDHVGLLVPGEYHADTSELIQMLRKGHYDVQLDTEAWDRLITWIDLNGPCHGTWGDVGPIPDGAERRRQELRDLYGGPKDDPEAIPDAPRPRFQATGGGLKRSASPELVEGLGTASRSTGILPVRSMGVPPMNSSNINEQDVHATYAIDLGEGVTMKFVRIPAGRFVMGEANGEPDEMPAAEVSIEHDFWMGACEVTNAQYHQFDPDHNSGYFTKRFQGPDGPGLSLAEPEQPVVRVSWKQAMEFCRWFSQKTGLNCTLPTEAQWEYACRAGSRSPLSYGKVDADFSQWANVADKSLSVSPKPTGGLESNIVAHFGKGILESAVYGGNILCDIRFDDGTIATADVGSYQPNGWGLYDMHGNACEWTRTTYKPYPYQHDDGRDTLVEPGRKVVRGGSWCDRPKRCRSAFRLSYPAWQRVHNVGFRIVCEGEATEQKYALRTNERQSD
jgi:formylglycine-generating enzyme required for sulfatase activity